ncbi:hypothetical protein FQR65_LT06445 [Abscondita terminalis]|nr:hypothetical protein FQR65_LT06445 [Abscondita terminalis]
MISSYFYIRVSELYLHLFRFKMLFYSVSAIFIVGLVNVEGLIDYRLAKDVARTGSKVCENKLYHGFTCRNCTTLVHCESPFSTETVIGNCPDKKLCIEGRCLPATNCPFPNVPFICSTRGIFPDPGNCTKYHICTYIDDKLVDIEVPCEGNENGFKYGFDPEKLACSYPLSNGECRNKCIPFCKQIFDAGTIERTSIYYECRRYVNENNEVDPYRLYPYQYRCPNGKIYNVTSLTCK